MRDNIDLEPEIIQMPADEVEVRISRLETRLRTLHKQYYNESMFIRKEVHSIIDVLNRIQYGLEHNYVKKTFEK